MRTVLHQGAFVGTGAVLGSHWRVLLRRKRRTLRPYISLSEDGSADCTYSGMERAVVPVFWRHSAPQAGAIKATVYIRCCQHYLRHWLCAEPTRKLTNESEDLFFER